MSRWVGGSWLALALLMQGCAQAGNGSSTMTMETLHASGQCGDLDQPAVVWIANAEEWQHWYARTTLLRMNPPPPPTVDFSREGVLLIAMGARTTGGYGLSLAETAATVQDGVLTVPLEWREPPPGYAVTQVMTSPCLLAKLPAGAFSKIRVVDQAGQLRLEGSR